MDKGTRRGRESLSFRQKCRSAPVRNKWRCRRVARIVRDAWRHHTPVLPLNRTTFDEFLFAPLGDEENGMTLSVVSALARLGLDPWREAARLALLPKPEAAAILAGWITRLPTGGAWSNGQTSQVSQLVALLPSATSTVAPPAARIGWPRIGFAGICLILVLAAIAGTFTAQRLMSRAPPSVPSISAPR